MKPKTMILMGLAITCGLGASYMTSRLLAERQAPDEPERVKILVAKRNLSVGERLYKPEEVFEFKEISKDSEPPDAIKDFEVLKDRGMKQSRNKGEHVTAANLRNKDEQLDIPDGHFAMGMRVNLEGSASGFATLPKSRVNIIQTVRGPDTYASYSQILLENVLVLAADLKLNSDGELASPAQVVTFALTGDEVLRVNLAKELGILSLALRRYDDKSVPVTWKVKGNDLDRDKKKDPEVVQEVKPEPKPVVPPPPTKVEPEVKPDVPQIVRGHYDIVNGSQSGVREVTRVHYHEAEDGSIVIDRTELVESTRRREAANGTAPKQGGVPQDF
jgi:pilus assembly protein CpaB